MNNIFIDNIHSYNGMEHNRYTTSIRNIIYSSFADEDYSNPLSGYKEPLDVIDRGRKLIFNFDYPIIDKTFQSELVGNLNPKDLFENAFITKYITDEIAFESFAEFQMKLMGKLLEIIPLYNAKCNLLFSTNYKDIFGGYILDEKTDNTHKDNNENNNTRQGIGTRFPINNINNVWVDLEKENYATDGNAIKNNDKNKNEGEYHITHNIDKTNKFDINKINKFNKELNNILSSTLNEFKYLFMGIM